MPRENVFTYNGDHKELKENKKRNVKDLSQCSNYVNLKCNKEAGCFSGRKTQYWAKVNFGSGKFTSLQKRSMNN